MTDCARMTEEKFQVSFDSETVAVVGRIRSREELDKLKAALAAYGSLLPLPDNQS